MQSNTSSTSPSLQNELGHCGLRGRLFSRAIFGFYEAVCTELWYLFNTGKKASLYKHCHCFRETTWGSDVQRKNFNWLKQSIPTSFWCSVCLATKSPLLFCVAQILRVLGESAIAVRTKAMKCLSEVVAVDPSILARVRVCSQLRQRKRLRRVPGSRLDRLAADKLTHRGRIHFWGEFEMTFGVTFPCVIMHSRTCSAEFTVG